MINYKKLSSGVVVAFMKYKEQYRDAGIPSVSSFVAGYNAAKAMQDEVDDLIRKMEVAHND